MGALKIHDANFQSALLGRDVRPVQDKSDRQFIEGKRILITGGAGSIGSEIVRQLLQLGARPEDLYFVDDDEYALYCLELGVFGSALLTRDNFALGGVHKQAFIDRIFAKVRPQIVYHAAARKHLPLCERSPEAAIETNILGTEVIAAACVKFDVERFVNISTDKATRPTSVLGYTKRLAEVVVNEYASQIGCAASVRFGNVLGSRGSFLETLEHQFQIGGTITLVDPEATRFFMSIPEAASLVIKASTYAEGGETYLLDMGTSISILDIVHTAARLFGLEKAPNVVITGLRPGEKLHEELCTKAEIDGPTQHPRIQRINVANEPAPSLSDIQKLYHQAEIGTEPTTLRSQLRQLATTTHRKSLVTQEA